MMRNLEFRGTLAEFEEYIRKKELEGITMEASEILKHLNEKANKNQSQKQSGQPVLPVHSDEVL